MPKTRHLLKEDITYSFAKSQEINILHQLDYYDKRDRFFAHLESRRAWMKRVVAQHLGLKSTKVCHVADIDDWYCGSFNVCIPVTISDWKDRQQLGNDVLIRFPLPYRVGEEFRTGNGDEKIQCEAGAYAWLEENCPDVPIPQLYGFAMSSGETFTRIEYLPTISRWFQLLRRQLLSWLGFPMPTSYARSLSRRHSSLDGVIGAGYILIEKIEERQGTMLSKTWFKKHDDIELRTNFFQDLSRILLSISRIPLPRIGSFVINGDGYLSLSNRPVSVEIQGLENERIPTDMPRDFTYSTVESYLYDLLRVHDNRLKNQPNAVLNVPDAGYQMSALAGMRTTLPLFFRRELCRGPFVFSLTDLHQSNIFVDDDWHITCLVDLEWACSRPIEMVEPPYWLTNKPVDSMDPEEYDSHRTELMAVMATEERKMPVDRTRPRLSRVMEDAWSRGTFWYTLAITSPTGLFKLFYKHIQQPWFSKHKPEEIGEIMPFFWAKNAGKFVAKKLSDKEKYDHELRLAFGVKGTN